MFLVYHRPFGIGGSDQRKKKRDVSSRGIMPRLKHGRYPLSVEMFDSFPSDQFAVPLELQLPSSFQLVPNAGFLLKITSRLQTQAIENPSVHPVSTKPPSIGVADMAEGDEEEKSGGHGDEKASKLPIGFRFKPTDEELVRYYLLPRLQGRPAVPNDAIIEANVYQCHPEVLIDEMYKDRGEDSWYFLSPRCRKYDNGTRPTRSTEDGLGRWKMSMTKMVAKVAVGAGGSISFRESGLAYYERRDEGPDVKTESKTKWLMQELTIPQFEHKLDKTAGAATSSSSNSIKKLDDYVMCKIYVTPKPKHMPSSVHHVAQEEAGPSGTCQEAWTTSPPGPAESSQGATAEPGLSERAAGKRPVEGELVERPTPPALRLGQPAQLQVGAVQARFGTKGYYGGCATGRLMTQSSQESNPPLPPPQVPFNCQVPPSWPAAAPSSFAHVMMTGPLNPAGETVEPPSDVGRYPEQMQRQPETEDMPQQRVIQQVHAGTWVHDEYNRMWMGGSMQQPTGYATYSMQQQRSTAFTQHFGASVNDYHHVGAMATMFSAHDCHSSEVGQQGQYYSCAVPEATDDSCGATTAPQDSDEEAVKGDCSSDDEKSFVGLATTDMSPDETTY